MTRPKGFSGTEVAGAFAIVFTFVLLVLLLVSGAPGCSVSVKSTPTDDPKDRSIAELRKQLAEAQAKLKAEATPQAEMVDQMSALKAQHAKELAAANERLGRQIQLFEETKVESCLAGLQSRIKDTALKFERFEKRFQELDQRLRQMQEEIDGKANRGHGH